MLLVCVLLVFCDILSGFTSTDLQSRLDIAIIHILEGLEQYLALAFVPRFSASDRKPVHLYIQSFSHLSVTIIS